MRGHRTAVGIFFATVGLPAAGQLVGPEFQVNEITALRQSRPEVALDAAGRYVMVWRSETSPGFFIINARRYDASGAPLTPEFRVSTEPPGPLVDPAVATNPAGDFVVVWNSGTTIQGQRFGASGVPAAGQFRVDTFSGLATSIPDVAFESSGGFVVVWHSLNGPGTGFITGQRFLATGAPSAAQFRVNSVPDAYRNALAVVSGGNGETVLVWRSLPNAGDPAHGFVRVQRFDSTGSALGLQFSVNTVPDAYARADVAADTAGGFVVVWDSASPPLVHGRRYDPGALPLGNQFVLPGAPAAYAGPSVASGGSGFVVTWNFVDDGSPGVVSQLFNASGSPVGGPLLLNTYSTGIQIAPRVAGNASGFVVVWHDAGQDGSSYGVFGRRVKFPPSPAGAPFRVNTITSNTQRAPSVAQDSTGAFLVVWSTFPSALPGQGDVAAQPFSTIGSPVGGELRVNQNTTGYPLFPSVAANPAGGFVVAWYRQTQIDQYTIDTDVYVRRVSSAGAPIGEETRVNTYTTLTQNTTRVSADASGAFVVTWVSGGQFATGADIYAQRFSSSGNAAGAEFRVNTTTAGGQFGPTAAASTSGFVIVWGAPDGDSYGVFGQRFASSGAPAGPEFRVNLGTAGNQRFGAVAMDPTGGFIVVWESAGADGFGTGIVARRFASSGAPAGSELVVDVYPFGDQTLPSVSIHESGDFLVTWYGPRDRQGQSIVGQFFKKTGEPTGPDFLVNTYAPGDQRYPSASFGKNVVVVWQSDAEDGSSGGIFAQRFLRPCRSSDENGDGQINVSDVLYLINNLFAGGPAPVCGGDADGNGVVNVSDVLYLINHLFAGGPAPI